MFWLLFYILSPYAGLWQSKPKLRKVPLSHHPIQLSYEHVDLLFYGTSGAVANRCEESRAWRRVLAFQPDALDIRSLLNAVSISNGRCNFYGQDAGSLHRLSNRLAVTHFGRGALRVLEDAAEFRRAPFEHRSCSGGLATGCSGSVR